MSKQLTRKEFLQTIGLAGIALVGGGVLASCGKSDSANKAATSSIPCSDVTGLTEQEKQTGTMFKYTGVTTDPAKACDICALWEGTSGSGPCGTCQVVKGPINPKGTCTAFAPKPS